jgi:hypothetical protein
MDLISPSCTGTAAVSGEWQGSFEFPSRLIAVGCSMARMLSSCTAIAILLGLLAGCTPPEKLTAQDAAIATQTINEMNTTAALVAKSRYRVYRWLTAEEMTVHRLGYDPGLDSKTREEVTQAVEDELANMGYQEGDPADFTVAFSDVYLDQDRMLGNTGIEILKYPEEKFTVAFFDAQTGKILWHGRGKESLTGSQHDDKLVTLAVSHALEGMPVPLVEP